VKQYLDGLQWDGIPRVDTWLITAASVEDSSYVRAVSSIMLIAAVRRIRQPGCKYDEMVVWESSIQGTDKSSAAQALCPNPAWFSDDLRLNLKSQQLIEATLGKWIIEASDLAGKRKTEIEQLKAMLSRQVDGPARMAYAHFPVERPRHFIIIGTTNSTAYLTDPTGARRFWPMTVQRFDVAWIKANRDQLWAEACVREATDESIRLSEDLWPEATEHQNQRREIDAWEDLIAGVVDNLEPTSTGRLEVTADACWIACGVTSDRRDRFGAKRISEIMQRLGFTRCNVWDEKAKRQVTGYRKDGVPVRPKEPEAPTPF
jgi:predicted P-loop ATPase